MLPDGKYMLFTSYRRDQTPVSTPVWVVGLDEGQVAFWTSSGSGKAKRVAHTAKVTVQACDARGRVKRGSEPIEGTAVLVSGPEFDAIRQKIVAKYGAMTKITKVLNAIGNAFKGKRLPYGDRGVVVTLRS